MKRISARKKTLHQLLPVTFIKNFRIPMKLPYFSNKLALLELLFLNEILSYNYTLQPKKL